MRRNGLITGLVIVLCGVLLTRLAVQFGLPSFLKAAVDDSQVGGNIVGTHAAFFDVGGNIKIADLVKSKANNKKLMITVMVDIKASASDISSVVGSTSGLTPIVRIVGVDSSTTLSDATGIAERISTVSLPSGTLVVFGNELNNLQKEWKSCPNGCAGDTAKINEAGSLYDALFEAFKSKATNFTAVPAPPDMYNGDYDWKPFVQNGSGANRPAYTGQLVANSYDLTGEGGPGNDLYKSLGNVVALTEYGPSPKKSLQEHINFFKSNPPPLPATTLIPDKCKSDDHQSDQWLFYIDGKIYDANGNEIDPESCDKASSRSGSPPAGDYYKRFIYPFYSQNSTVEDIKRQLEADYTVACANPANYGTSVTGAVKDLIERQNSRCNTTACLFSPEAVLSLDATGNNRLFGVMRNETEAKWRAYDASLPANAFERSFTNRFESVEQWFGANNPAEGGNEGQVGYSNQTPDEITGLHQGPFYKLTPLVMQCKAAVEVLEASASLCDTWSTLPENSGQKCSLTERLIPGTTKSYGSLRNEIGSTGAGSAGICEAIYETDDPQSVPKHLQDLALDLSKVDLYMETAYRPAFLVLTTGFDTARQLPLQTFSTTGQNDIRGRHVVDFLVYHVPDTITDIKEGQPGAVDDIVTRTAKTFISQETTDQFIQDYQQKRTGITQYLNAPPESIECRGGVCDEKLRRALIDFINAYIAALLPNGEALNCKEPDNSPAESGTRIGSELAPNDTPDSLRQSLKNGKPIDKAEVGVKMEEYRDANNEVVDPKEQTLPGQTFMYNVAPYGMRTQYVAQAFDALFAADQQEGQFREDDKYLTSFEAIFGDSLESKPNIVGYTKPVLGPDGVQLLDENGNPRFEQKDVRDEMKINGHPPFSARIPWLAKVFNYSTRGIVQQISSAGENLLECARAVTDPKKNTEDFLLRCQTRGNAVGSPNNNAPNQYTDFAYEDFEQFEIQYWNGSFPQFNIPPTIIWEASVRASQKHACDPLLVVAVAHSEDQSYTNHQNPNEATARGVWQFTAGNWNSNVWTLPFFTGASATKNYVEQDGTYFNCLNPQAEDVCSPTNIYAAADAACRFVNAIGLSDQYQNQSNFTRAFSQAGNPFNRSPFQDIGRVWNLYPPQGEYVWRLWHALSERDYEKYKLQNNSNSLTSGPKPSISTSPTNSSGASGTCADPSFTCMPKGNCGTGQAMVASGTCTGTNVICCKPHVAPSQAPATSCPSGQSCLPSASCSLIGTPGASCGGGNVCCSTGAAPTQPATSNSCAAAGGTCTDGPACLLASGTVSTTGTCSGGQTCCITP